MGVDIRGQNPTVAVKDIRSTGQICAAVARALGSIGSDTAKAVIRMPMTPKLMTNIPPIINKRR